MSTALTPPETEDVFEVEPLPGVPDVDRVYRAKMPGSSDDNGDHCRIYA
jgi:hypothetical protein